MRLSSARTTASARRRFVACSSKTFSSTVSRAYAPEREHRSCLSNRVQIRAAPPKSLDGYQVAHAYIVMGATDSEPRRSRHEYALSSGGLSSAP